MTTNNKNSSWDGEDDGFVVLPGRGEQGHPAGTQPASLTRSGTEWASDSEALPVPVAGAMHSATVDVARTPPSPQSVPPPICSALTSACAQADSESDENLQAARFDSLIEEMAANPVEAYEINVAAFPTGTPSKPTQSPGDSKHHGDTRTTCIPFLVRYGGPRVEKLQKEARNIVFNMHQCHTCSERAYKFCALGGPDGPAFLAGIDLPPGSPYARVRSIAKRICSPHSDKAYPHTESPGAPGDIATHRDPPEASCLGEAAPPNDTNNKVLLEHESGAAAANSPVAAEHGGEDTGADTVEAVVCCRALLPSPQSGVNKGTKRPYNHFSIRVAQALPKRNQLRLLQTAIDDYVRPVTDGGCGDGDGGTGEDSDTEGHTPEGGQTNTMLTGFVRALISTEGMAKSIDLFEACLDKASQTATYKGTVRWMKRIIRHNSKSCPLHGERTGSENTGGGSCGPRCWDARSPTSRLLAVMHALGATAVFAGTGGGRSSGGRGCLPQYHQGNGSVFAFLRDAADEEAMVKLIEERTAPETYRRKTGALSEGQLRVGIQKLGDFTNTVMTEEQLWTTYPDKTIRIPRPEDPGNVRGAHVRKKAKVLSIGKLEAEGQNLSASLVPVTAADGFARLAESLKPKAHAARGNDGGKGGGVPTSKKSSAAAQFAQRCEKQHTALPVSSVAGLLCVLTDGHPHDVYIEPSSHSPVVLAETTMARDMRKYDHFWAFWNTVGLDEKWGVCGGKPAKPARVRVETLYWMPAGQLMFVCKGAVPLGIDKNLKTDSDARVGSTHWQFAGHNTKDGSSIKSASAVEKQSPSSAAMTQERTRALQRAHKLGNCCFPGFLAPHLHDCERAFEALSKATKMVLPEEFVQCPKTTQCAVGIGLQAFSAERVVRPLTVWIDGVKSVVKTME